MMDEVTSVLIGAPMAIVSVVTSVLIGASGLVLSIMVLVLICCGGSMEERAAAERRATQEAAHALALRRLDMPAPVELTPVAPATKAAAPVVSKLGYFLYSAEGRRASENLVCAICLEVLELGEKCSEVPACQHLFHTDCIDVWMKTKTTCPLCRGGIVAGSEQLSAADDMV